MRSRRRSQNTLSWNAATAFRTHGVHGALRILWDIQSDRHARRHAKTDSYAVEQYVHAHTVAEPEHSYYHLGVLGVV